MKTCAFCDNPVIDGKGERPANVWCGVCLARQFNNHARANETPKSVPPPQTELQVLMEEIVTGAEELGLTHKLANMYGYDDVSLWAYGYVVDNLKDALEKLEKEPA